MVVGQGQAPQGLGLDGALHLLLRQAEADAHTVDVGVAGEVMDDRLPAVFHYRVPGLPTPRSWDAESVVGGGGGSGACFGVHCVHFTAMFRTWAGRGR